MNYANYNKLLKYNILLKNDSSATQIFCTILKHL